MKLYYITTAETHERCAELFDEDGAHYFDLPVPADAGPDYKPEIILIGTFRDDVHEAVFAQQPGVQPLPYPNSGETMGDHPEVLAKLAHLGVQAAHTIWHVSKILGAIHPHMGART